MKPSFIERNIFAPKQEKPKKPKEEMVGEILGEEGRKAFEKKLGKKAPAVEESDFLIKGFTKEEASMELLKLRQAEKLLGRENVHGPQDVEFLLGFKLNPKDIPPLPYSEADFLKSKEIKEKTGVEEMLVLFTKDEDGSLLTGERLDVLIQKKYDEMGLGKFLFDFDTRWYRKQVFYKTLGLQHEWKLITKRCIPNSKNKRHHFEKGDKFKHEDTQEYAIEQYAEMIGVPRAKLHRPEPFQMLDAAAVHLTATERDRGKGEGERLLKDEFHWSDVRASDGGLVNVGDANRGDGAFVHEDARDYWLLDRLGVCLSRDPS